MTVTGYLILAVAAVAFGIALGGLIALAGSCSEEARARKLGARLCSPPLTGTRGQRRWPGADSSPGDRP